jgi:myo-inositol-1(or 4)-monophosphatase
MAAGIILVREAGGLVQPIRDGQDLLEDGHVLAGAEPIFDQFAKLIRERDA